MNMNFNPYIHILYYQSNLLNYLSPFPASYPYKMNRENLLFLGEYQIYFIERGEKIVFLRVHSTSENADIFTAQDEMYLVFAAKK